MASSKINQAGHYVHGQFQNHGLQFNGATIHGSVHISNPLNAKEVQKQCWKALKKNEFKDPVDDREDILSLKPPMITATFNTITDNQEYKNWRNIRKGSQLLWVSGGQAKGKTMLAIFITQEFDKWAHRPGENITVLYYFLDRKHNRDTAIHVLRGLILRLLAVRKELIHYLLEEYETSPDTLFEPNQMPTLWRVFVNMVRDPRAGQVYCIIDGLDACTEDSLRRLVGLIRNFFLKEAAERRAYEAGQGMGGMPTGSSPKPGAGLKMMLVSREEPQWLKDELQYFPCIPYGSAKKPKKAPNLRDVASTIIRKQTLQKAATPGPSVGESSSSAFANNTPSTNGHAYPASAPPYVPHHVAPNGAEPVNPSSSEQSQLSVTSAGFALTTESYPNSLQPSGHLPATPSPSPGAYMPANESKISQCPSSTPHPSTGVLEHLVPASTPQEIQQPASAYQIPQQPSSTPNPSTDVHGAVVPANTPQQVQQPAPASHHLALGAPNTPAPQITMESQHNNLTATPSGSTQAVATTPLSANIVVWSPQGPEASVSPPLTLPVTTQPPGVPASIQTQSEATIMPMNPPVANATSPAPVTPSPSMQPQSSPLVAADVNATQPSASHLNWVISGNIPQSQSPQTVPDTASGAFPPDNKTMPPAYPSSSQQPIFQDVKYTEEPADYSPEGPATEGEPGEHADIEGVEEEDEDFNPTLRVYIEAKFEELAKNKVYSTKDQSFIVTGLENRGDGTFLWVDFAVEELKKVPVEVIEQTVNSLPPALDEMYARILLNIPTGLVEIVIGMLRWIVCARRPMDLLELAVALNLSHYNPQDASSYIINAVASCGNMLKLREADWTVNIVHQSLVEFLTGDASRLSNDPRLARFHINPGVVHGDITTFCISYLESGPFNQHPVSRSQNEQQFLAHVMQWPLFPYAASFWPDHLKEATNPFINLSSPFFLPKSIARKNWWKTYWGDATAKHTLIAPVNFNVLHLAAYLNLVPVAQQVAQRGELQSRLNKRDSHGMAPLDYAVAMGNIDMFKFLLAYNAKQEPLGETLLELACRKGQREMVALLLDMGWDVNLRAQKSTAIGNVYNKARWLPGAFNDAFEMSRDNWHMMFRDVGAQETPLHKASTYGHIPVVELLLERGAEVGAGTTKGFTALHAASYTGQLECVELLIDHRSSVYWVTTDNWLPLHYAAMRGKVPVVEYFLDKGVPIDSMTVKSKTALHLAAYGGQAETVQFLVERGAQMELRSYKGETPLHLATRHLKPQVVELLLSLGANRMATNNGGFTPLQVAQASKMSAGVECARILSTYGTEGYVPWQAPEQAGAAPAAAPSGQGATATDGSAEGEAARRASMASASTGTGYTAAPRANTVHGFEASVTVEVQPVDPSLQGQPAQPVHGNVNVGGYINLSGFTTTHPEFSRTQSEPGPSSKFSYEPNANMQAYTEGDSATAFASAVPPSVPPPPYSAAVGNSPPQAFPEKSAAWTAQFNAHFTQGTTPEALQASFTGTAPMPTSPPVQSVPPVQVSPPAQPWTPASNEPQHHAASAPITPATQSPPAVTRSTSTQSGMVQMLSSLSISGTGRAPTPAIAEMPASIPSIQTSPPPNVQPQQPQQPQQPYYPPTTPTPQYQTPMTPSVQTVNPTPLMSPFQPAATPVSPYQATATPVQPFPQQQFQTPATPIQPTPFNNPIPNPPPMGSPFQNNNVPLMQPQPVQPQATHPQLMQPQPMHPQPMQPQPVHQQPMYSPQPQPQPQPAQYMNSYPQQPPQQPPQPVQSPFFSGNSTASTYNTNYTYSAPAPTPYNPSLGNMQQQPPQGGWPMQPMFSGPPQPQPGQKKKSFLGGLVGTRNF